MVRNFDHENFDARNERIETGAVVTIRRVLRGVEKRTSSLLSLESKKDSVREETNAVSGTTDMSVQNRQQKPLKGRKCVEKTEPQRPESVWEDQSTAVQKLLERYLH